MRAPAAWKEHLAIGLAAMRRGFLTPEQFAEAMEVAAEGEPSVAVVWLDAARLTADQLAVVDTRPLRGTRTFGSTPASAAGAAMSGSQIAERLEKLPVAPTEDRYAYVGDLGEGGVGEVIECLDRKLDRRVALKALRRQYVDNAQIVAMLEREARVTGRLEHPNIIPVHDLGLRADIGSFYVMRLVDEPTLENVLDYLRLDTEGMSIKFSLGRLLRCFIQVCQAVEFAHSRGVVHCDLKPGNILVGSFGEVLVLDWGLAFAVSEGVVYRGGTPGYMAPEQAAAGLLDARSDVFALGAILYEMLCLEPAFEVADQSTSASALDAAPVALSFAPPIAPHLRSTRPVPAELEEACLKALALEPERRFQTARLLADAIESFLEGTKERERRQARALALVEQGAQLAESYRELLATRPERLAELAALRESIEPWDPPESKRPLWNAEERNTVTDGLAVRTLQAAVAAYEQALDEVPGDSEARRGLTRLYLSEMQRAQNRRDELERIYFEELVKQFDDGAFRDASAGEGTLSITCSAAVEVSLAGFEERDRRLIAGRARPLGPTPLDKVALPPGSYAATVSGEDSQSSGRRSELVVPVLIRPGREYTVELLLDAAGAVRPGEVFVPGGVALLGGDETASDELYEVAVPPFFIDTLPVSFFAYLQFLSDAFAAQPEEAAQFVPRGRDDAAFWQWGGNGFTPARVTEWGTDVERLLQLPAFGVDARSAEAYAAWRSGKSGLAYRLPTEQEWEKAARGVDGRRYPWGDQFDAAFCKMRQSRPGLPRPEASGTFEYDVSPYGVRDMAGGIADWVVPVAGRVPSAAPATRQLASRGGAWCDWRGECRVTARRAYLEIERSPRIGFRLARSVPRPPG